MPPWRAAGADGLELAVQATRDGVAVVADSPTVGRRPRRRRIASIDHRDLPAGATTPLAEVFHRVDGPASFLLHVADSRVFDAIGTIGTTQEAHGQLDLWLAHHDKANLVQWRPRTSARLILVTRLGKVNQGMEQLLAGLHADDIDGLSMYHRDWSGGTIALAHRFGLRAVAGGTEHHREMAAMVDAGIDAMSAVDPGRLSAVVDQYYQ